MSKKVYITGRFKSVPRSNPISGHYWTETVELKGYEVHGGWFCTTTHTTLKGAEKEKTLREELVRKFPWECPRSDREIARAKNSD